ncbi:ABC transporter substrate-binding protein [uncultured Marinobacter sp.]|uniref:ABC transporter substrate-binding protein n=1 Tax=uncultured Marinobacter sp. TaxID=187379 RepID=UPI00263683C8|nr:ABC transporter substrate-binding protein [uncultured Marinobacter sp.]
MQAVKSLTAAALLRTLMALAYLTVSPAAPAQDTSYPPVYLAGSGNLALDHHIQSLLERALEGQNNLVLISDEQAAQANDGPIVTLGPGAFSRIRQINREAPVLALLVEPDFLEGFARRSSGHISGIYHGATLLRQALIGKAILPQATRIALMATSGTAEVYDELIDQLQAYQLEARLFVVDGDKQLIPTLNRALSYGDFLLAAPDNTIYNPRTIKHVLLTAYRRNRIVIGPSQAYVKAGSLASGYAPFPAMVEMAEDYLKSFFESGEFPRPGYPPQFRVEINEQVARSLNIPLATPEQIIRNVELRLKEHGGQVDE